MPHLEPYVANEEGTNETSTLMIAVHGDPAKVDVRGIRLLQMASFYQCFSLMGILTGIGLMTIK
jgi:hypothetical protein